MELLRLEQLKLFFSKITGVAETLDKFLRYPLIRRDKFV